MSHKMSTANRGTIMDTSGRTARGWPPGNAGRPGRNAFIEPEEMVFGPNGRVGGNDPCNTNDLDGDFDAGPYEDWEY